MSSQPAAQRLVRFGLFELDLAAGELRKQGRKIKLQDQPFQVLELLLNRPGEVVTREELQQALWPADTFVEFDQGLNTAIKKIRLALEDSADNPRFVETIPRKGYRFIAPISQTPARTSGTRRYLLWVIGLLGLIGCAAVAGWWFERNWHAEPQYVPVPLTSYPGWERSPTFSPDGNHVAFVWTHTSKSALRGLETPDVAHIYVKLIGTDEPVRLTRDESTDFDPAWSPDGRLIVFLRPLPNDKHGVFLVPAIGGADRKVAEVYGEGEAPSVAWHPGGKWLIVVDKDVPDQPSALFLLSVETGEKRRLTSPPPHSSGDKSLAVSPDGRVVAFCRMVADGIGDLFLLDLSEDLSPASQPKRLTFDHRYIVRPAWISNGRGIIFSAGTPHSTDLYEIMLSRLGRRAGQPRRLAFAGQGARGAATSRQGRLAYSVVGIYANIWRLELNGTGLAKAAKKLIASTHLDHKPQYSPDGKRIAFASNRFGSHEIWVCNSDGSGTSPLTSFGGDTYTSSPNWSPDGRQIAFDSRPKGHSDVFLIGSDGGQPKRLTNKSGSNRPSGWSHDGKWIYFDSDRSGTYQVWKMRAEGGEQIQITRKGGAVASESPDGRWLYYLKDDHEFTSLWKVPSQGGEETQVLESVCCQNFAVVENGIYFIPKPNTSIKFLSFDTGKVTTIAKLGGYAAYGFSVSPDGRWLLYPLYEPKGADLMLVENFR
jgi:Tol biopolymer transport system component/DNA-binding winged helix-turn-helix (wHTH) protein